jgi:hypothetical protein
MMRMRVALAEIKRERICGWKHFHPEAFCHRCGGRNISWFIKSKEWNAVMRTIAVLENRWAGIICPQCFVELHEARFGQKLTWELRIDEKISPRFKTRQAAATRRKITAAIDAPPKRRR